MHLALTEFMAKVKESVRMQEVNRFSKGGIEVSFMLFSAFAKAFTVEFNR